MCLKLEHVQGGSADWGTLSLGNNAFYFIFNGAKSNSDQNIVFYV